MKRPKPSEREGKGAPSRHRGHTILRDAALDSYAIILLIIVLD